MAVTTNHAARIRREARRIISDAQQRTHSPEAHRAIGSAQTAELWAAKNVNHADALLAEARAHLARS